MLRKTRAPEDAVHRIGQVLKRIQQRAIEIEDYGFVLHVRVSLQDIRAMATGQSIPRPRRSVALRGPTWIRAFAGMAEKDAHHLRLIPAGIAEMVSGLI
jgi:hypothetical protein